jgi:hypothetical protein
MKSVSAEKAIEADGEKKKTKRKMRDDRGVSLEMSTKFTLEERIPLLLIHSYLHLLGYDHEKEKDWVAMTKREDEVIKEFYHLMKAKS